ncbi:MAG TPA: hypothetical protein ENH94_11510 [Phycisphaerales bacterium]|nr:hypothetical protein [Phycisphaerales bacterium]
MKICNCREYSLGELTEFGKKAALWDSLEEVEEAANEHLWYMTVGGGRTRRLKDRRVINIPMKSAAWKRLWSGDKSNG